MNLKIFDDAKSFYERIKQNFSDKQMENDLMLESMASILHALMIPDQQINIENFTGY
jgi:uncharacterized tellurite resistance protein B-like protein